MDEITALIQKNGWTQLEAAKHCSVTQPRINELLRGRNSRFSLDARVNIAAHLGQQMNVASWKQLERTQKGCFGLFSGIF